MTSHNGTNHVTSGSNVPARRAVAFGDAVVAPSGRIGMLCWHDTHTARVQFGPSGPFRLYRYTSLRHATLTEVNAAGMYGVGFNIIDEDALS